MDDKYFEQMERYGFTDCPEMRRRWRIFTEHRRACRAESARLHQLFERDRSEWRRELIKTGKSQAEIKAHERRENFKSEALRKLHQ